MDHYTDYENHSEALIGFCRYLRNSEIKIGIQESKDLVSLATTNLWFDHIYMEHGLSAICCNSPEEIVLFRRYYNRFWRQKGTRIRSNSVYKNQKNIVKGAKASLVMLGTGNSEGVAEIEESKTTSGANGKETLKQTDFKKLSLHQNEELDRIADQLVREMSLRVKRRLKKTKTGQIDIKNSIRKNIQNGGNIINLSNRSKTKDKFRLLVLLDVSGSMDKYSYYLLKFLWALKSNFKHLEVFAFSTIIKRITTHLDEKDLYDSLMDISENVTHWSSGTKIGECLREFNDNHSKRLLNGRTVTIILSDGLDTGEPMVLSEAIQKIKLKSKRLIWLNPLKGMQGYEPIQEGVKIVMPSVDIFESAHNMNSLLDLEKILMNA